MTPERFDSRAGDEHPDARRLDPAVLHALGALDGPEAEAYRRLLADEGPDAQRARADVAAFQRTAAQLGAGVRPVAPPPSLKTSLMARIQKEPQGASRHAPSEASPARRPEATRAAFTFIRADDGPWLEPQIGLRLKILHVDPATQRTTAIAKFAPGYRHAPHRHAQTEELFVLEGGCLCQGQALFPGDYHRSEADSIHGETTTQDGCTLLIIFSPHNEAVGSFSARLSSMTVSLLFRVSAWCARVAGSLARRR